MMEYKKIVLLGTGKLFLNCLAYVKELGIPYIGYDVDEASRKMTQVQAEKRGLAYARRERREIYRELEETEEKTLLLSVINPYIIPESVLKNENILALNCHQALLPAYKGRNAEAWVIYEGETVTGVTWHKMLAAVDCGDILSVKEIPVTEESTSFKLFREQIKEAYEAFTEFMPLVIAGKESYSPQPEGVSVFHYAKDVPEDGRLDLSWDGARLSRFLRAMDYGVLEVMPKPLVCMEDGAYTFKSYRIEKTSGEEPEGVRIEGDTFVINRQGYRISLLKCVKS